MKRIRRSYHIAPSYRGDSTNHLRYKNVCNFSDDLQPVQICNYRCFRNDTTFLLAFYLVKYTPLHFSCSSYFTHLPYYKTTQTQPHTHMCVRSPTHKHNTTPHTHMCACACARTHINTTQQNNTHTQY